MTGNSQAPCWKSEVGYGTIKDMRQKSTAQDFPHEAFDHEDDTLEGQDLQGTAAFDSGVGAMPSWGDIVAQHADSVFRSIKNYQPGTFEGWLHRITTNLFLDMVRHRSKISMESLPEDYERVPGTDMTPEQAYTEANLDPALQEALDSLAPDFKVAVVLCDVVGMSYDEIADTLGGKMGTVRSRIHRGRSQLRAALEAKAEVDNDAKLLIPQYR